MGRDHPGSEEARRRLIAWLAELGPRWGLPGDACRVHGHLYLTAAAATRGEIARSVELSEAAVGEALDWLAGQDLATEDG